MSYTRPAAHIDFEQESVDKIIPPSSGRQSVVSLVPIGCLDVRLLTRFDECKRLM